MLEGDGAKEKFRARKKDRPEEWGECPVLNRTRERLGRELAPFLSQAEERHAKDLGPAEMERKRRGGEIVRAL